MGAFKLGNMTFGSLFKKPETVLYPIEKKPQPAGLKGHIEIVASDCILCSMCERSCPTSCITVDKKESYWAIDRFACIQCGYCTTVCPKKCLHMQPGYAAAEANRHEVRVMVEKAPAPAKKKAEAPAKQAAAEKPAATAAPSANQVNVVESRDELLESKLASMDPAKAEKVRAALKAKA